MTVAEIELCRPVAEDGHMVHQLVADCPPLDPNSMYCNLLQAHHFAATSVAAKRNAELVGFISGYLIPDRLDTLFIWQVAVGQSARGCGLATRMLHHILSRSECAGVRYLETSITESNQASWALFRALARELATSLEESVLFDRHGHFGGRHATEALVRIEPF